MHDKHDHSQLEKGLETKIIGLLANYLGTEAQEIKPEDGLENNLHMTPSDIYEFVGVLKDNGLDISEKDIEEVASVADLVEAVSAESIIN